MKLLVLGSEGNLGGQILKIFSQNKNYDITAWDKDDVDITDKELIQKKIKDLKPDIIINTVGYNAVDKCEEDDDEYDLAKKINIDAPRYLAEVSLEVKSIFVHYSSDYVFGGNVNTKEIIKKGGYSEEDEVSPVNRYGKTKAIGEKQLIQLSGKGLKWYLIRPSKLFGPKGKSEITKLSFFDLILNLSKEKKVLDLVDEEISCFTYTLDLAVATKKLIEDNSGYGIYHITNSEPATWYESGIEMFKILNEDIKINAVSGDKFSRPAKRPNYSVLKNTKLNPLRSWKEALEEYLLKNKI